MKVTLLYAGTKHEHVELECQGVMYSIRQAHPTDNEGMELRLDRPLGRELSIRPRVSNAIVIKAVR